MLVFILENYELATNFFENNSKILRVNQFFFIIYIFAKKRFDLTKGVF